MQKNVVYRHQLPRSDTSQTAKIIKKTVITLLQHSPIAGMSTAAKLHCVPKKHVTTFSTITLTIGVRLQ